MAFYQNNDYEILTPFGFENFDGVFVQEEEQDTIQIETKTSSLICTKDHKIFTNSNICIEAKNLEKNQHIQTINGLEKIVDIVENKKTIVVDIINSGKQHQFYANEILVSNCILLDEFAFVNNNVAEEFMRAAYPTITAGTTTKVIVVSTPNGMNQFYKLWKDATSEPKRNFYIPIEVAWSDMPGRDEKWKQEQIVNMGSEEAFNQEFGCQFFGDTASTLISPLKLKTMEFIPPIYSEDKLDIFERPQKDHSYIMCVDTSHGIGADFSAFIIIDVTTQPYKVVAKYKNNSISPLVYPMIVLNEAKKYNNAFVLVESNDVGCQVVDSLHYELLYDNLFSSMPNRRLGTYQVLIHGNKKSRLGIRTTKTVKNVGCSTIKNFIENNKLILNDFDIISEFTTFISQKSSYAAEAGSYDDLVMCLVLFGWLASQKSIIDDLVNEQSGNQDNSLTENDIKPIFGYSDHQENDEHYEKMGEDLWLVSDKDF
jgi:hypothetical protein